jgi:hypothetical protein
MVAASSAFDNLTLSLVTDEQPTEFAVRAEARGMPNVTEIVKIAVEMERMQRERYLTARRQFEEARAAERREIDEARRDAGDLGQPRVDTRPSRVDRTPIERKEPRGQDAAEPAPDVPDDVTQDAPPASEPAGRRP